MAGKTKTSALETPLWLREAIADLQRELKINKASHQRITICVDSVPGSECAVMVEIRNDRPMPLQKGDLEHLRQKVHPRMRTGVQVSFQSVLDGDLNDVSVTRYDFVTNINKELRKLGEPFVLMAILHTNARVRRGHSKPRPKYVFGRIPKET